MRTMLRTACLLGLVTGMGAVAASAADMERLALVERAATDVVTDTGASGDTVGDILTFANEVYDEANATMLGTDNGWCVRTVVGKAWECFWTMSLADGQITVEGPFLDAGDSTLAITGGTGAYAGVSGEMKLHARNDKGSEYDFVYMLSR
jgi:allene oxide cyclase